MTTDAERMHDVLEHFDTAMLVTRAMVAGAVGGDHEAGLDARPMAIARLEKSCDLWFFTSAESEKVDEITADPRVQIVAQDGKGRFVSLAGTAHVLDDRGKAAELWSEPYEVWFPDGLDDARLRLIHVEAQSGEYWDNAGANKVKYVLKAARAYAAGDRPSNDRDEHGTARL